MLMGHVRMGHGEGCPIATGEMGWGGSCVPSQIFFLDFVCEDEVFWGNYDIVLSDRVSS